MQFIGTIRVTAKKYKFTNYLFNHIKPIYYFFYLLIYHKKYLRLRKRLSSLHVKNVRDTIYQLSHSNMSLGRFGDGDLSIALNKNNGLDNMEERSLILSSRLKKVLTNHNCNFMIGLPEAFRSLKDFNKDTQWYWIKFINDNLHELLPYLNKNKIYYNTCVTRPYIDFYNKKDSGLVFYLMKQIWNDKNVLIIEGNKSRVGVKDDLLKYARNVRRIECPAVNTFESYKEILHYALQFLKGHRDYISLLSLGPTATVLSLDLCNRHFRAIDIGNLDLEYQWYLLGVNHRVNLPYKYVNAVPNGNVVNKLIDNNYTREIVYDLTDSNNI